MSRPTLRLQYEKNMATAIILAAGTGSRLWPLTNEIPKCLISIGGLPILHHQLSALEKNKITDITIVVGFMADAVRQYAENCFRRLKIEFVHNPIFENTNTLYSLALAASSLKNKGGILLINGDVVFDLAIIGLLGATQTDKSFAAIVKRRCAEEEIKFSLAHDGSITNLNKKIDPAVALGEAIGINKFSKKFWAALAYNLKRLQDASPNEYFEFAVEETIRGGNKIYPCDVGKHFAVEIDFWEDLEKAERVIRNGNDYAQKQIQ